MNHEINLISGLNVWLNSTSSIGGNEMSEWMRIAYNVQVFVFVLVNNQMRLFANESFFIQRRRRKKCSSHTNQLRENTIPFRQAQPFSKADKSINCNRKCRALAFANIYEIKTKRCSNELDECLSFDCWAANHIHKMEKRTVSKWQCNIIVFVDYCCRYRRWSRRCCRPCCYRVPYKAVKWKRMCSSSKYTTQYFWNYTMKKQTHSLYDSDTHTHSLLFVYGSHLYARRIITTFILHPLKSIFKNSIFFNKKKFPPAYNAISFPFWSLTALHVIDKMYSFDVARYGAARHGAKLKDLVYWHRHIYIQNNKNTHTFTNPTNIDNIRTIQKHTEWETTYHSVVIEFWKPKKTKIVI